MIPRGLLSPKMEAQINPVKCQGNWSPWLGGQPEKQGIAFCQDRLPPAGRTELWHL